MTGDAVRSGRAGLRALLSSRVTRTIADVPVTPATRGVLARTMDEGFVLADESAAASGRDYRASAAVNLWMRFRTARRPRLAQEIHEVIVRQKGERTLQVEVQYGMTRAPQAIGALMLAGSALAYLLGLAGFPGDMLLLMLLPYALVLLVMPRHGNRDGAHATARRIESALREAHVRVGERMRAGAAEGGEAEGGEEFGAAVGPGRKGA